MLDSLGSWRGLEEDRGRGGRTHFNNPVSKGLDPHQGSQRSNVTGYTPRLRPDGTLRPQNALLLAELGPFDVAFQHRELLPQGEILGHEELLCPGRGF